MALALPWDYAAGIAAASAAAGIGLAYVDRPRMRAVGAFLREAGLILALYGFWQLAGRLSITGTDGAIARAHWIEHVQGLLHLPSEAAIQQTVLWSPMLTQAANIYYAVVHFPATIAFLIWLFVRHRDRYGPVRWVLATTTLICLAIQLLPVAPPRLLPGYIDTAREYGQSVYASGFGADQLSAMPSVHVAWALLVGYYVWRIGARRWRWIGPAHAGVTIFVVVVTANHWWLDGAVAAAVLISSAWAVAGVRHGWELARRKHTRTQVTHECVPSSRRHVSDYGSSIGVGLVEFQDDRERALNLSQGGLVHATDPTHQTGGNNCPGPPADREAQPLEPRLQPHRDPEC